MLRYRFRRKTDPLAPVAWSSQRRDPLTAHPPTQRDSRCRMADAEGRPLVPKDWNDPATKALVALFYDPGDKDAAFGGRVPGRAAVLLNAGEDAVACEVPGSARTMSGSRNRLRSAGRASTSWTPIVTISPAARAILIEQPSCERGASAWYRRSYPRCLQQRGIAPHWFDVNGNRHKFRLTPNALCSRSWPASVIGRGSPREPRIARSRTELRPFRSQRHSVKLAQ